jgi:hypothetical protein
MGMKRLLVLVMMTAASATFAGDHDDTNALKSTGRHDARLNDLHVFTAGPKIVFTVSTNPTVPKGVSEYQFPSDLTVTINVDGHSRVRFDDADATARLGGKVVKPRKISADQTMTVTFDDDGTPQLATTGIPRFFKRRMKVFAGLRDDPFIRGPRTERNVGAIVIEADLRAFTRYRDTLLVWANAQVPSADGPIGDLGARALRSQFAANLSLNDFPPNQHESELGVPPDVLIFHTTQPAVFPNGRGLDDDVVDAVCGFDEGAGTCLQSSDCPASFNNPYACSPSVNDKPFLSVFPYLAEPHAPCGEIGQACCTVVAQCATGSCSADGTCQ